MNHDARALDIGRAVLDAINALAQPHADRDELIALRACGLERNAIRELERRGKIPVVKIGRLKYTRRLALLEAFDVLHREQMEAAKGEAASAPSSYENLVSIAGRKTA